MEQSDLLIKQYKEGNTNAELMLCEFFPMEFAQFLILENRADVLDRICETEKIDISKLRPIIYEVAVMTKETECVRVLIRHNIIPDLDRIMEVTNVLWNKQLMNLILYHYSFKRFSEAITRDRPILEELLKNNYYGAEEGRSKVFENRVKAYIDKLDSSFTRNCLYSVLKYNRIENLDDFTFMYSLNAIDDKNRYMDIVNILIKKYKEGTEELKWCKLLLAKFEDKKYLMFFENMILE